ncbi:hypothetical protein C3L33_10849, partial [Rhododendron williamsianum]
MIISPAAAAAQQQPQRRENQESCGKPRTTTVRTRSRIRPRQVLRSPGGTRRQEAGNLHPDGLGGHLLRPFRVPNSNSCKPIVVKVRNGDKNRGEHASGGLEKNSTESSASQKEAHQPRIDSGDRKNKKKTKREKQRPFYYLLAVVVLILLVLAVFGRSFAIIFVSVGWYLVPAIKGAKESDRRRRKKREYGTRESEKKIDNAFNELPSPKSNGNVAAKRFRPAGKAGEK